MRVVYKGTYPDFDDHPCLVHQDLCKLPLAPQQHSPGLPFQRKSFLSGCQAGLAPPRTSVFLWYMHVENSKGGTMKAQDGGLHESSSTEFF